MRKLLSVALLTTLFAATCGAKANKPTNDPSPQSAPPAGSHWKGAFSNGMKGAKLSFDLGSNEVNGLTFQGYWRCDGKLELTTLGPKKGFTVQGNKVDGIIKESGFYFELHGTIDGNKASGTLRIAFVASGCDTYKLNWTAEKQ